MLTLALSLAAQLVSPLTVDVVTADGSHRPVHIVDADATPVEACAKRPDEAPVCAPVTSDRTTGLSARLDIVDDESVRYGLVVKRSDLRTNSTAAIAGGFAVATAIAVTGGTITSSMVIGMGESNDASGPIGTVAFGFWLGAGAAAAATGIVTTVAVLEAQEQ